MFDFWTQYVSFHKRLFTIARNDFTVYNLTNVVQFAHVMINASL